MENVCVVAGVPAQTTTPEDWRTRHAAEELAAYLTRLTGAEVPILTPGEALPARRVFVVGNESENALTKRLVDAGTIALAIPPADGEGFAYRSAVDGNTVYLVVAGETPAATLWAVYDYLERYCEVGFFMDGEYVPEGRDERHDYLFMEGVDFASKPVFKRRNFHGTYCGAMGLRKYHYAFRRKEDWQNFLDWIAKRKQNLSSLFMNLSCPMAGTAPLDAFGLTELEHEAHYVDGWPNGWTYPPEYFTEMTRMLLAYGRERGLKFPWFVGFGEVPYQYRRDHPELPYLKVERWDHGTLSFDASEAQEFTKRYMAALIDTFGTDHHYYYGALGEVKGAETPEESLELKIRGALKCAETYREVDPQATLLTDSWDFAFWRDWLWSPENVKHFLDAMPDDSIIVDAQADKEDRFYKRNGYFFGKDWMFGIIHHFQGDDQMHGDLADLIARVKDAVHDPNSTGLTGFSVLTEAVGANIVYWQLATALSWNPDEVDLDTFIRDYCKRRYGRMSARTMERAWKHLVESVYSPVTVLPRQKGMYYYKRLGGDYEEELCPLCDKFKFLIEEYRSYEEYILRSLRDALDVALTQRFIQQKNSLYENDLVEIAKAYWAHTANLYLLNAYDAFTRGEAEGFEENLAAGLGEMRKIELLLSTREDYHLKVQIDEVEAYPGSNRFSAEMIKQTSINWNYSTSDVYELYRFFYIPQIESWGALLRGKLAKGITTFESWDEYNETDKANRQAWLDNPLTVPDSEKFQGSTIDCILTHLRGRAVETEYPGARLTQSGGQHVKEEDDPALQVGDE